MKCLSVRQPWAWAIMAGKKRVENRTWRAPYRGQLLIHAGLQLDTEPRTAEVLAAAGVVLPSGFERGVILGTVELVEILPIASVPDDPLAFGPWCWILERPQLFPRPIPWVGQLGLFEVVLPPPEPAPENSLLF